MTIAARLQLARGAFALDVELAAPDRGVTAIFGPSGCGKTTLLRCLAGLERVPGGVVRVSEAVWQDEATFMPPHRRGVGYVFQEASLFPHLDVRGNLHYAWRRTPPARRRPLEEVARLLGIEALLDRRVGGLSGGERQRVAIARALAMGPELLLLDEPLAALDIAGKRGILPALDVLRTELNVPVLYVSHALDEVARIADHLVVMAQGRVTAAGPIAELLARPDLPLAPGDERESLIEATVAALDEVYGLATLDFAGGRFTVPRGELQPGQRVRLRIRASDVALALQAPADTSILNACAGIVDTVVRDGAAAIVRLDLGGVPLLARITRRSADTLALGPGRPVVALIKSVAVLS